MKDVIPEPQGDGLYGCHCETQEDHLLRGCIICNVEDHVDHCKECGTVYGESCECPEWTNEED